MFSASLSFDLSFSFNYLFDFSKDKLIIGQFCQIATGVRFITNAANNVDPDPTPRFKYGVLSGSTLFAML